jgi:hypothetical protein
VGDLARFLISPLLINWRVLLFSLTRCPLCFRGLDRETSGSSESSSSSACSLMVVTKFCGVIVVVCVVTNGALILEMEGALYLESHSLSRPQALAVSEGGVVGLSCLLGKCPRQGVVE